MQKKTIGILGGMGPLATADLFRKIIVHTQADTDQQHFRVLIDNNTGIPDRTRALLAGGPDPFPEMRKSAKWLEAGGADLLVMPCNTAHHYHARLQAEVNIPVLHMIELTCQALRAAGVRCAGLLATTGTIRTGVYADSARACGITLLLPSPAEQEAVMDLIYRGVKAGAADYDTGPFRAAAERLLDSGAQSLILGCTELPLAAEQYGFAFPAVDPTLELAKGAIRLAGGVVRP